MKTKLRNQKGFTIIEVLIVLAIAGLIMLIVFLAVPALQRNARNTQRTSDGSRLSAAVSECLNNNNGVVGSCNSLSTAKLTDYISVTENQQLNTIGAPGVNAVQLDFGYKCKADGSDKEPGGGTRAFTVTYLVETKGTGTAGRCIGS